MKQRLGASSTDRQNQEFGKKKLGKIAASLSEGADPSPGPATLEPSGPPRSQCKQGGVRNATYLVLFNSGPPPKPPHNPAVVERHSTGPRRSRRAKQKKSTHTHPLAESEKSVTLISRVPSGTLPSTAKSHRVREKGTRQQNKIRKREAKRQKINEKPGNRPLSNRKSSFEKEREEKKANKPKFSGSFFGLVLFTVNTIIEKSFPIESAVGCTLPVKQAKKRRKSHQV